MHARSRRAAAPWRATTHAASVGTEVCKQGLPLTNNPYIYNKLLPSADGSLAGAAGRDETWLSSQDARYSHLWFDEALSRRPSILCTS